MEIDNIMEEREPIEKFKEKYGENYSQHYFDQYKVYIDGMEKISDRRESANKYFFAMSSGIIVSAGFIINSNLSGGWIMLALFILDLLGIAVSIMFWFLINSYKQLNSGKLKILHKIEKNLPIKMYSDEWVELGEGNDMKKYLPFSHIERVIPLIFGAVFFLCLIVLIFWMIASVLVSCY